eukprot:SAG11_NODE_458_length_9290_cov_2.641388_9_plen_79_part_00
MHFALELAPALVCIVYSRSDRWQRLAVRRARFTGLITVACVTGWTRDAVTVEPLFNAFRYPAVVPQYDGRVPLWIVPP